MPSLKLQLYSSNSNYNNCSCTIQAGANNICIALAENAQITSFELFEVNNNSISEYQQCLQESTILKTPISSNKVVFNATEFLLVPSAKFSVNNIDNYLAASFGDVNPKSSLNCTDDTLLNTLNMHIIYRISNELYETVNKYCQNAKFIHAASFPIRNLFASNEKVFEKLKIQFYQNTMLVIVVYNNQLKLAQSYSFNTPEDIIYYLLNILQEFSLNVESTIVEVCGVLDINSQHFKLLQSLFSKLSFETLNYQSLFANNVDIATAHFYTPFINAALCE